MYGFYRLLVSLFWGTMVLMFVVPYLVYCPVRDTVLRHNPFHKNRIFIIEMNPNLFSQSPFPYLSQKQLSAYVPKDVKGHDAGDWLMDVGHCYAEVSSFKEAEKWLLDKGYVLRPKLIGQAWPSGETMTRYGVVNTPILYRPAEDRRWESCINIEVDYGDGMPEPIFFTRYPSNDFPMKLSKFKTLETNYYVPIRWMNNTEVTSHWWYPKRNHYEDWEYSKYQEEHHAY